MNARNSRRLLLAALVLSLLLHAILAGYLRWPTAPPSREQIQIVNVRHATIARIAQRRRPAPAPLHRAKPSIASHVAPPALSNRGTKGPPQGIAVAVRQAAVAVTPLPTPQPTASAVQPAGAPCIRPDAAPQIASTPNPSAIPGDVRARKGSGTARVTVSLDAAGHVLDAKLAQSSGDPGLDLTAVQMAQSATYAPRVVACKAVAGQYTFSVRFVAW